MKKTVLTLLAVTLLCPLCLGSCGAPEVPEIHDRVVGLVEASYEINEIFFGEGLPTYPRVTLLTDMPLTYSAEHDVYYLFFEDAEAGRLCMYYDAAAKEYRFLRVVNTSDVTAADGESVYTDAAAGLSFFAAEYTEKTPEYVYGEDDPYNDYNVVRADAAYTSIDAIKAAAEKVYTKEYLEAVYQGAFDGVGFAVDGASGVRNSRFIEYDYLLRQYGKAEPLIKAKRIYDYGTMKIISPSNSKRVNLTMDTHLEGETEILNVRLTLILGADGQWYLDSPTY